MAYREVGMVHVREIVRRWLAGDGLRSIARALGVDRKTVAEYVRLAHAAGIERDGAPPTEAQLDALAACRRPGRPVATAEPSADVQALIAHRETIRRWLSEDALRLTKVYRRLRAQGVAVSYSTLYRFARAQCDFTPAAVTVRVADPPAGEAAEVDFGLLGLWTDPATGARRRIYGLLVTLCFSRYALLWISLRQDLAAVLDGLEAAWAFYGGVVRRLVSDNLKPVVTRADRYAPTIDRVFLEYAQFRGFLLDPAVVRHATGKTQASYCTPFRACDAH
jgi:transposase